MIAISDSNTIGEAFCQATERCASNSLLAVPANPARSYDPAGPELSYAQAAETVRRLMAQYRAAGYGLGHCVGLFLKNRPEHMLHKLALNALGVCYVPINPDYRARELAYVVDRAEVDLIVALTTRLDAARVALALTQHQAPSPLEGSHCVRFGYGAGVEPQLHAVFEARYGFPLLELWGMTERVRPLCDNRAPRQVGTRAFGRTRWAGCLRHG